MSWRDRWERLPRWAQLLIEIGLPVAGIATVIVIEKRREASAAADTDGSVPTLDNGPAPTTVSADSGGVPMLDSSSGSAPSSVDAAQNSSLELLQAALPQEGQWLAQAIADAADKYEIDPLMFAAFPAWESDYGGKLTLPYDPQGEGDNGNAVGPFQLDKRFHEKFLSSPAAADIGQQADYVAANVIVPAMKAFGFNTDAVIAAYNAGVGSVKKAIAAGKNVGSVTTMTPYGSYVDAVNHEWQGLQQASQETNV